VTVTVIAIYDSIAGLPSIAFTFAGTAVTAELAGATLRGEMLNDRYSVALMIVAANGEILHDLVIMPRPNRSRIDNVQDTGAALLWAYWRWKQARKLG
jgi:hypothetical protein